MICAVGGSARSQFVLSKGGNVALQRSIYIQYDVVVVGVSSIKKSDCVCVCENLSRRFRYAILPRAVLVPKLPLIRHGALLFTL